MIRAALLAALLTGCAAAPVCNCKLPAPPDSLLVVPKPLPPIALDIPPELLTKPALPLFPKPAAP